jgi:hypothetical protein
MYWIGLARDRDQWIAFVNTEMNFGGSIKCWEVLQSVSHYQPRMVDDDEC